jgi:hypothetical protein
MSCPILLFFEYHDEPYAANTLSYLLDYLKSQAFESIALEYSYKKTHQNIANFNLVDRKILFAQMGISDENTMAQFDEDFISTMMQKATPHLAKLYKKASKKDLS